MNLETKEFIPNHDKPYKCKDCRLKHQESFTILQNCPIDTPWCIWTCDICNIQKSISLHPPNIRQRRITKTHSEMLNICDECAKKL